jgi:hypothetical protein
MTTKSELYLRIETQDIAENGSARYDYLQRRVKIVESFHAEYGIERFQELLARFYVDEKRSCNEIAEIIEKRSGEKITARSVERSLRRGGVAIRPIAEAFPLAASRGRVVWVWKTLSENKNTNTRQIGPKLRLKILTRDNFKCKLCGSEGPLEVDHIVSRSEGGGNDEANLRTLCHDCNFGKRLLRKEEYGGKGVRMESGKSI